LKSESKKPRMILDTKPIIKLFAQEEGWESVQGIMSKIEAGELEAGISVVTLTEIYYRYLNEDRKDLAATRTLQLRYAIYLKKFEITEDIAVKAGEFKGKENISIADAFIAATAHSQKAIVISDDPDFKKLSEIMVLSENEFFTKMQA